MSDPRPGRTRPPGITPAGLRSDDPGMQRPPRPMAVELATAIVIVSGAMSVLISIEAFARMNELGSAGTQLTLPSIALGLASMLLGLLLRTGRAWLVGVNVLAIAGFLELISGTPLGMVSGALDALAVIVLMVYRPWFQWQPGRQPGDAQDDPED
ncbi:MAG TPA: hypothetical protein VES19_00070 [Candidatus Limnocylindrales bacterium]|nr:hypothetical protein [Candidatus Limnocylindrales bacterium]